MQIPARRDGALVPKLCLNNSQGLALAHQLALLIIHHLEEVFHALQREQVLGSTAAELAWADRPDAIAYIVDFDPSSAAHGEAITYFRSNTYRVRVVRDG